MPHHHQSKAKSKKISRKKKKLNKKRKNNQVKKQKGQSSNSQPNAVFGAAVGKNLEDRTVDYILRNMTKNRRSKSWKNKFRGLHASIRRAAERIVTTL